MAYITPNSDLYILKNISLDEGYNHTMYFTSELQQYNTFYSYKKYALDSGLNKLSYQRAGKNKIRVPILADNLYDCNYIMFRNTSYGNKWFYAFLMSPEYINDNCTELTYVIDVMQTWYFDYELGECFVEREHSSTDVAGDNIVPENLEIGELISNDVDEINFNYMLGAIIMTKPLPNWWKTSSDPDYYRYIPQSQEFSPVGASPCGICNGVYIYFGFASDTHEAHNYWSTRYSDYTMVPPCYYATHDTSQPRDQYWSLQSLLYDIGHGDLPNVSQDDIISVFLYPAEMNLTANITRATTLNYKNGISMGNVMNIYRPDSFKDNSVDLSPFIPKNNKLFTYPYIQLHMSNNRGKTAEFRYEDFIDPENPTFVWLGNYIYNPTILCCPVEYKGVGRYYDCGLIADNFPTPAFLGSQLTSWLESNRNSMAVSLISSTISGIATLAGSVATENAMMLARGGQSLYSSVVGTLAKLRDLKNAPPQFCGQLTCDTLNAGIKRTGFKFYNMTIKKEFAKIVDNYFTMFGYAVKKVKIPTIRDTNARKRIRWNYVKTNGCIVHPASGRGLPAEDEKKISQIYDSGVTFWNSMSEIGNYSLPNTIEIGG